MYHISYREIDENDCFDRRRGGVAIVAARHQDLVRMLINSLFWTVVGVLVAVLAI
jgi:uncharacterized protein YlxP (DUF503 family)